MTSTPEQRRVIDARLDKADAEIKAGRTYGPFNTASEMVTHMRKRLRKNAGHDRLLRTADLQSQGPAIAGPICWRVL